MKDASQTIAPVESTFIVAAPDITSGTDSSTEALEKAMSQISLKDHTIQELKDEKDKLKKENE